MRDVSTHRHPPLTTAAVVPDANIKIRHDVRKDQGATSSTTVARPNRPSRITTTSTTRRQIALGSVL